MTRNGKSFFSYRKSFFVVYFHVQHHKITIERVEMEQVEIVDDISALWDSVVYLPLTSLPIIIRVFKGAENAHQIRP